MLGLSNHYWSILAALLAFSFLAAMDLINPEGRNIAWPLLLPPIAAATAFMGFRVGMRSKTVVGKVGATLSGIVFVLAVFVSAMSVPTFLMGVSEGGWRWWGELPSRPHGME
jgi:bacteriorhodopsin